MYDIAYLTLMFWMVYSKWKLYKYDCLFTPQFEEYIYWFGEKIEWGRFLIMMLCNTWFNITRGWFEHPQQGLIIEPDSVRN